MSGTDWRALCEELLRALTTTNPSAFGQFVELEDRARAALAQPEPEVVADGPAVPEGREPAAVVDEPSDEELLDLAAAEMENSPNWEEPEYSYEAGRPFPCEAPGCAWVNFARAVLAHWGRPAPAPAEPEISAEEAAMIAAPWSYLNPPPAGAGEVGELVAALRNEAIDCGCTTLTSGDLRRIADLLEQRQGAPVPVALSERPPGPEGLDDKGKCWEWDPTFDAWVLLKPIGWTFRDGPWLPFNALPLPSGEVQL